MSWYPKELVRCYRCGRSYSTPIDKFEHQRNGCRFPVRAPNEGIYAKVGTGPLEVVYSRRHLVMNKPLSFKRGDGTKFVGIIDKCEKDFVFIRLH